MCIAWRPLPYRLVIIGALMSATWKARYSPCSPWRMTSRESAATRCRGSASRRAEPAARRSSKPARRERMRSGEQGMATVEMPVEKAMMPAPEARRDADAPYELVIERWPRRTALLARPVALPRAVPGAGVAGHFRALQTDGDRGGLGHHPPVPDHGRLHRRFRQTGPAAVGRHGALRADGFRRDAAVDVLCHRGRGRLQQPDRQCQPHQQSVFPTPDRADRRGDGCLRRFPR